MASRGKKGRGRKGKRPSAASGAKLQEDAPCGLRIPWEVIGVKTREVVLDRGEDEGYVLDGLGLQISTTQKQDRPGAQITKIVPNTPASHDGNIYTGDVILEIDNQVVFYSMPHEVLLAFSTGGRCIRLKLAFSEDERLRSDAIEEYRPNANEIEFQDDLSSDRFAEDATDMDSGFVPTIELKPPSDENGLENTDPELNHHTNEHDEQIKETEVNPLSMPPSPLDSPAQAQTESESASQPSSTSVGEVLDTLVEPEKKASKAQLAWQRALTTETDNPELISETCPGYTALFGGSGQSAPAPGTANPIGVQSTKTGDSMIRLRGSKLHSDKMGMYVITEEIRAKRPVYVHEKGFYLFFHNKNWRVSNGLDGEQRVFLRAGSPAKSPDKVRSVWQEAKEAGGYQSNASIKATSEIIKVPKPSNNDELAMNGLKDTQMTVASTFPEPNVVPQKEEAKISTEIPASNMSELVKEIASGIDDVETETSSEVPVPKHQSEEITDTAQSVDFNTPSDIQTQEKQSEEVKNDPDVTEEVGSDDSKQFPHDEGKQLKGHIDLGLAEDCRTNKNANTNISREDVEIMKIPSEAQHEVVLSTPASDQDVSSTSGVENTTVSDTTPKLSDSQSDSEINKGNMEAETGDESSLDAVATAEEASIVDELKEDKENDLQTEDTIGSIDDTETLDDVTGRGAIWLQGEDEEQDDTEESSEDKEKREKSGVGDDQTDSASTEANYINANNNVLDTVSDDVIGEFDVLTANEPSGNSPEDKSENLSHLLSEAAGAVESVDYTPDKSTVTPIELALPEPSDVDLLVEEHRRAQEAKGAGKVASKGGSKKQKKKKNKDKSAKRKSSGTQPDDPVKHQPEVTKLPHESSNVKAVGKASGSSVSDNSPADSAIQMNELELGLSESCPSSPKSSELIAEWKEMHAFLDDKLEGKEFEQDISEDDNGEALQFEKDMAAIEKNESRIAALMQDVAAAIPEGLTVETKFVAKSSIGFGFQVKFPQAGHTGLTISHLVPYSPATKAPLSVGHIIVAINTVNVLQHTTLQQLSDAVARASTEYDVGGVAVSTCTAKDYMIYKYNQQVSTPVSTPQRPNKVNDRSFDGSAPASPFDGNLLSSTPAKVERDKFYYAKVETNATFTKSVPDRLDTIEIVQSKMESQRLQAQDMGLDSETIAMLSEEISRLKTEHKELHLRPPAVARTLDRSNSADGNSFGLSLYLCKRAETCRIESVVLGGPADAAGLKIGDVVMEIDGLDVYKQDINRCTSLLNKAGEKLEIGIIPNADIEVLPLKALRDLSATEKISSVLSDIRAAPDIGSYLFGLKSPKSPVTSTGAGSSRRLFGGNANDSFSFDTSFDDKKPVSVSDTLYVAADEAEHQLRMAYRKFMELSDPKPEDSAYASLLQPEDASTIRLRSGLKRITIPKAPVQDDFVLKVSKLDENQSILQLQRFGIDSPFNGAVGGIIGVDDVLLAVNGELFLNDNADKTRASEAMCNAEGALHIVLLDDAYMYDLPEDQNDLKTLVNESAEEASASLWEQFKKWQLAQAQSVVQPKAPVPLASVRLDDELSRKQASSSTLGPTACLVCKVNPKSIILGCGHCICKECAEKAHKCPIVGCGRLIVTRSPLKHRFRSTFHEKTRVTTTPFGLPLPATNALDSGRIFDGGSPTRDRRTRHVRDSGVGTIAGGWKVAEVKKDGFVQDHDEISGKSSKAVRKRSSRIAEVDNWERQLPPSHLKFDSTTEV